MSEPQPTFPFGASFGGGLLPSTPGDDVFLSDEPRTPRVLRVIIAGFILGLLLPEARAQWVAQSFELHAGWNALYSHVDASTHATLRQLVERDPGNPITEIWLWEPDAARDQFLESPAETAVANSQWRSWKRGLDDAVDNSLSTLPGNAALLVRLPEGQSHVWRVVGKPVPPRHVWRSSGLNFVGFPTSPERPPTFPEFFASAPELDAVAEVFAYGGPSAPFPLTLQMLGNTPVRRGQAFWVRSGTFFNRYFGPFDVTLQDNTGIHFGGLVGQYRLRLRNTTAAPVSVVLRTVDGAPEPPGQEHAFGRPPLLLRGPLQTATLTYGFTELSRPVTNHLAPAGQPGFEAEVVLGLDRSQLAGPAFAHFAAVLELADTRGLSLIQIPVTATQDSTDGLWVGTALVSEVREHLRMPVREPAGENQLGTSPALLDEDLGDFATLAARLVRPFSPVELWLSSQLAPSTRRALAGIQASITDPPSIESSKFLLAEVLDLAGLADQVVQGADPLAAWLQERLPADGWGILRSLGQSETDPRRVRAVLVDTLNRAMVGPGIFSEGFIARDELSADTLALLDLGTVLDPANEARRNRRLLDDALAPAVGTLVVRARQALLDDLNRIIRGPAIYRADRFEGVALSEGTRRLVADPPQGDARAHLNRALLVEAFPGEILADRRQYAVRAPDLRSPEAWLQRLGERPPETLSAWIWEQLSPQTRAAIDADAQASRSGEGWTVFLAQDLDRLVRGGSSLYHPRRFDGIPLSTETAALLTRLPSGADLLRLNRMLLEDAFPGALVPHLGRVLVDSVRTRWGGVARPFPLRLIVHSGAAASGPPGPARLLQRVYLGHDLRQQFVVTTREEHLDPQRLGNARRISAAHLPWTAGNEPWNFNRPLAPGAELRTEVRLAHDDHASNPFLHTYHPDHDNRNTAFDEELPRGWESYAVSRRITLKTVEPTGDFEARTSGNQVLSGIYIEQIRLEGRSPGGLRPDEIRTLEVRGGFALHRVHQDSHLLTAAP